MRYGLVAISIAVLTTQLVVAGAHLWHLRIWICEPFQERENSWGIVCLAKEPVLGVLVA